MNRYMAELFGLIRAARQAGARVTAVKLRLPDRFRTRLPNEDRFDRRLEDVLGEQGVAFRDYSRVLPEPRYYFDPRSPEQAGGRDVRRRISGWTSNRTVRGRARVSHPCSI